MTKLLLQHHKGNSENAKMHLLNSAAEPVLALKKDPRWLENTRGDLMYSYIFHHIPRVCAKCIV